MLKKAYRQISILSNTKFQNLDYYCVASHLSLPDLLKTGVKSIMKILLEQRQQAMLQLHLSDQQFIAY